MDGLLTPLFVRIKTVVGLCVCIIWNTCSSIFHVSVLPQLTDILSTCSDCQTPQVSQTTTSIQLERLTAAARVLSVYAMLSSHKLLHQFSKLKMFNWVSWLGSMCKSITSVCFINPFAIRCAKHRRTTKPSTVVDNTKSCFRKSCEM
jgi:hypothetical protein